MKKVLIPLFAAVALFGAAAGLPAQEPVHVVAALRFQVKGLTGEQALRAFLSINPPLREGVEFPTAEALSAFLARKRQDLVNRRVFRTVEIRDEAGAPSGGKTGHTVTVAVEDAITVFPLPYADYDSNSGVEVGIETKYDNGLGTMTNWYLDMYAVLRDRAGSYGIGPWKLHPRISHLILGGLPFTLDAAFERQENKRIELGALVADWACYRLNANLGTSLDFPGNWYVRPKVDVTSYLGFEDFLPGGSLYNRDVLSGTLSASAGIGRVNWTGNFRSGADANVGASVSVLDRNDVFHVSGEIGATTTWYLPWLFLDYYGRLRAQVSLNNEATGLGSWLRGIRNSTMAGMAGVFLNQTLAIDVVPWKGVLDLQVHPFLDAGMVLPGSRAFSLSSDLRAGAGLDAALYIDAVSNFLVRCSVGVDLTASSPLDDVEIVINTSLLY